MRKFVLFIGPKTEDGIPNRMLDTEVRCYGVDHFAAIRQVLIDTRPTARGQVLCGVCDEVESSLNWDTSIRFKARSIIGTDGVTGWLVKIEGQMVVGN